MIDDQAIGKVVHQAWKRWRVEAGYPDHAFQPCYMRHYDEETLSKFPQPVCAHHLGPDGCHVQQCSQPKDRHHEDMIDWSDLRPEKRVKYQRMGMAVYEARQGADVDAWREAVDREWKARKAAEARVTDLEADLAQATAGWDAATSANRELVAEVASYRQYWRAREEKPRVAEARVRALEAENGALRGAGERALAHVNELRDAWQRGAISEHDGQGGTRSNRNVDVAVALRCALAAAPARGVEQ